MLTPQSRIFVDATRFHHYWNTKELAISAHHRSGNYRSAGNGRFFTFGKDPWRKLSPNALGHYATSKRLMAVQI